MATGAPRMVRVRPSRFGPRLHAPPRLPGLRVHRVRPGSLTVAAGQVRVLGVMADSLDKVKSGDFPLTLVVTMEDGDRKGQEVHRTQLDQGSPLNEDNFVSPDLDDRFPGKKKLIVMDAAGKTRHQRSFGES